MRNDKFHFRCSAKYQTPLIFLFLGHAYYYFLPSEVYYNEYENHHTLFLFATFSVTRQNQLTNIYYYTLFFAA